VRKWDAIAQALQNRVRHDEIQIGADYPESDVRRATVHAREDIVLLVSLLSSINRQLWTIKALLVLLLIGLGGIGFLLAR
jgi:hypothetical protein